MQNLGLEKQRTVLTFMSIKGNSQNGGAMPKTQTSHFEMHNIYKLVLFSILANNQ